MAGDPLSFNASGICCCSASIPSPCSSLRQWYASFFFFYDGYNIVVKDVTLRIVESVSSRMHKNPLTIGAICDFFVSRNRLPKIHGTTKAHVGHPVWEQLLHMLISVICVLLLII
jgi:hypothetical protein